MGKHKSYADIAKKLARKIDKYHKMSMSKIPEEQRTGKAMESRKNRELDQLYMDQERQKLDKGQFSFAMGGNLPKYKDGGPTGPSYTFNWDKKPWTRPFVQNATDLLSGKGRLEDILSTVGRFLGNFNTKQFDPNSSRYGTLDMSSMTPDIIPPPPPSYNQKKRFEVIGPNRTLPLTHYKPEPEAEMYLPGGAPQQARVFKNGRLVDPNRPWSSLRTKIKAGVSLSGPDMSPFDVGGAQDVVDGKVFNARDNYTSAPVGEGRPPSWWDGLQESWNSIPSFQKRRRAGQFAQFVPEVYGFLNAGKVKVPEMSKMKRVTLDKTVPTTEEEAMALEQQTNALDRMGKRGRRGLGQFQAEGNKSREFLNKVFQNKRNLEIQQGNREAMANMQVDQANVSIDNEQKIMEMMRERGILADRAGALSSAADKVARIMKEDTDMRTKIGELQMIFKAFGHSGITDEYLKNDLLAEMIKLFGNSNSQQNNQE